MRSFQLKPSKAAAPLNRQMSLPGERGPGGLPLLQLAAPTLVLTGSIGFASGPKQDVEENSGDKGKRV